MASEYRVKGSSIRSKFEFVRERFGAAAEQRFKERFRDRQLLPVLDSAMYPFATYDEVNRAIAEEFYDGDLGSLCEVGKYSAQKMLTGVYRAFAAGKDFPGFLDRAAILHERFYSHGRMAVSMADGGKACQIALTEAPTYSEADLQIAGGFYAGAAELLGVEGLEWRLARDDTGARFHLRWA